MGSVGFLPRVRELLERRQYDDVVKACRLGLLAQPASIEGRVVLAQALAALQRHDEVLAETRAVLEGAPENVKALVLRGHAYMSKGDISRAKDMLGRAQRLAPGDVEVKRLARAVHQPSPPSFASGEMPTFVAERQSFAPGPPPQPPNVQQSVHEVMRLDSNDFIMEDDGGTFASAPRPADILDDHAESGFDDEEPTHFLPRDGLDDSVVVDPALLRPAPPVPGHGALSGHAQPAAPAIRRDDRPPNAPRRDRDRPPGTLDGGGRSQERVEASPPRPEPVITKAPTPIPSKSESRVDRPRGGHALLLLSAVAGVVIVVAGIWSGSRMQRSRSAQQVRVQYERATALSARGDYASYRQSRIELERLVEKRSKSQYRAGLARIVAAIAFEFSGDTGEARTELAKLGDFRNDDAVIAQTYIALAQRDITAAKLHLAKLGPAASAGLRSYLGGQVALLEDRGDDAVAAFTAAITAEAGEPRYMLGLARALRGQGELEAAAARLGALVFKHPSLVDAVLQMARSVPTKADELAASLAPLLEQTPDRSRVAKSHAAWAQVLLADAELRSGGGDAGAARIRALSATSVTDWRFGLYLSGLWGRLGDGSRALAVARELGAAWPQVVAVQIRLAENLLDQRDADGALGVLSRISTISTDAGARAVRGRAFLSVGKYKDAAKDLDFALKAGKTPQVLVARAEVYLAQDQPTDAVRLLKSVYKRKKSPPIIGIAYARALRLTRKYKRARSVIEGLIWRLQDRDDAADDRYALYLEDGRIALAMKRYKDAKNAFNDALQSKVADTSVAALEIARMDYEAGAIRKAADALTALANEYKYAADIVEAAALANAECGRVEQAALLAEQLKEMAQAVAWRKLRAQAVVAFAKGEYRNAAASLQSAYGDARTSAVALAAIEASLRAELPAASQSIFRKLQSERPSGWQTRFAAARIALYQAMQDDAAPEKAAVDAALAARAAANTAKATPRWRSKANYVVGRAYALTGDVAAAKAALAKATTLSPDNADAHFALGELSLDAEQYATAVTAFESAIEANPTGFVRAWYFIGEAYIALKRKDRARAALEKYLSLATKGKYREDAQDLLKDL